VQQVRVEVRVSKSGQAQAGRAISPQERRRKTRTKGLKIVIDQIDP